MANRIILPKQNIDTYGEPIIFLAGPVSNANGWQNNAIGFLKRKRPNIYIAVPDYGNVLVSFFTILRLN